MTFFSNIYYDYLLRLLVSLVCGFCFGLERKIRHHTVGLRTLILLCVSSCLLGILSVYVASNSPVNGDPGRVIAAVVTGIGFLGAGAIFHQGMNIRGLTSSAIIFTVAAVGLACGVGLYIPAIITLIISLTFVYVMGKLEHRFFPAEKRKFIRIDFHNPENLYKIDELALRKTLSEYGIIVHDLDISSSIPDKVTSLTYSVKTPDALDLIGLTEKIAKFEGVIEVSVLRK